LVNENFVACFFTNTYLLGETIQGLKAAAEKDEKINPQVFAFELEDHGWAKGARTTSWASTCCTTSLQYPMARRRNVAGACLAVSLLTTLARPSLERRSTPARSLSC
jgi:hypothetical protein